MTLTDLDVLSLQQRLSVKWQFYGRGVLPAWVAEMDFPLAEPIRAVIRRALELDDFGYPQGDEQIGLGELFSERMRERYAWQADAQQVEVLTDVVQGIYVALQAYTQPGDGALVLTPIYPPFLSAVRETGRRLLASPLADTPTGFVLDLDHIAQRAAEARILLLCHPHNPTGRVWTRAELAALAELALEHDWVVVSDEIHADLTFGERTFVPFASLAPEVAARTITLTSASKAFNIAGLRCAVAHFGSAQLQQRFNACALPHARGSVSILGHYCTKAAWQEGGPWLEEVKGVLARNRTWLGAELTRRLPAVRAHLPEATYLCWLDCRSLNLTQRPAPFFCEHAKVALSDGNWFGGFDGFARLNFATSEALLDEMLKRMAQALAQ
jgi:cysteine-S-conjugate beta-lyase